MYTVSFSLLWVILRGILKRAVGDLDVCNTR